MASLSHGHPSSNALLHGRISLIGRVYGMTLSKMKLEGCLYLEANKRMLMRRMFYQFLVLERAMFTGYRASHYSWIQDPIDSSDKGKDHQTLKGEQSSQTSSVGTIPLEGKRELTPFVFAQRPSWYEMTLMDAQEQETTPGTTLQDVKSLTKFSNFLALKSHGLLNLKK